MSDGAVSRRGGLSADASNNEPLEKGNFSPKPRTARIRWKYLLIISLVVLTLLIRRGFQMSGLRSHENLRVSKRDALMRPLEPLTLSNGTHKFNRTTLVVALGGVNPSDLTHSRAPNLAQFISNDSTCTTQGLIPSYPTQSVPNLWTLVTGDHPINHGVIGNSYFDTTRGTEVTVTHATSGEQGWGGEPVWTTAARRGIRTAVDGWPGSTSASNADAPLKERLEIIQKWLNDPRELMLSYIPEIEKAARAFGPGSEDWITAVHEVDEFVRDIIEALTERNLRDIINLVFVSDHGMATVSNKDYIVLEEIIPNLGKAHISGEGSYAALYFENKTEAEDAYKWLWKAKRKIPGLEVYQGRESLLELYSFGDASFEDSVYEKFLPDIVVMPKAQYLVVTKSDSQLQLKGIDGYSSQEQEMAAVFAAQGPAFPAGRYLSFLNIDIYSALCRSVGIREGFLSDGSFALYDEARATLSDKYFVYRTQTNDYGYAETAYRQVRPPWSFPPQILKSGALPGRA